MKNLLIAVAAFAVFSSQALAYVPDFEAAKQTLSKGTIENLIEGGIQRCINREISTGAAARCEEQEFASRFKMLWDAAQVTKDPRDLDAVNVCFDKLTFYESLRCVAERVDPSREGYLRAR